MLYEVITTASLDVPRPKETLGTIYITIPEAPQSNVEERLLADVVFEKTGLENLSMNKIKKAGLKLVSGFTKENLTYKTDDEGEITEINYDSRLLAFTIPTSPRDVITSYSIHYTKLYDLAKRKI